MAVQYSGVPVDIVEVSLKAKPAEMLALSAKGTVPVLACADGRVIEESLDIMQWALALNDPDDWRYHNDAEAQQHIAELIEHNDRHFKGLLNRYKYAERYPEQPMEVYRQQGSEALHRLDRLLQTQPWLSGPHAGLADFALMPFVRQFAHVDRDWFAHCPHEHLRTWLDRHLGSPLFTSIMAKQVPQTR